MSALLSVSAFVIILVALGVLSSMRPGVTPWAQFPMWVGVAMSAFFLMVDKTNPQWFEVVPVALMAGTLWRYRRRLERGVGRDRKNDGPNG